MVLDPHKNTLSNGCLLGMLGTATKLGIVHVCDTSSQKAKQGVFQVKTSLGYYLKKEKNNKL